jgi:hypothetical protein
MIAESNAPDPRDATLHYRRAVDCLRPSRDATLLPVALIGQAGVLGRRDPAGALKVAAAASAIRARVGGELAPFYRARLERVRAACEAALGPDAERLWAAGARLGADDAAALAFGTAKPASGLARRLERSRARGRRPGRRWSVEQGDRHSPSPLGANRGEPRAPRARQGRARQPDAARHLGARADSVAIAQLR